MTPQEKQKICAECGVSFGKPLRYSWPQFKARTYCSRKCSFNSDVANTNRAKGHVCLKRTPEQKETMRQIALKRGISQETLKKMALARVGMHVGSKNPAWKDGRSSNPVYRSWLKNKRNRLKKVSEGSHTFNEWECVKKSFDYMCLCCKRQEPEIKLTEDHIIPVSKGGSDDIENIQPLCQSCNSRKNDKYIDYLSSFQVSLKAL